MTESANGRSGAESAGQGGGCTALVRPGRSEGRRQLVVVDGGPDHERPSGWEPSSVRDSGVGAVRAALLALAPLPEASPRDRDTVVRAAQLVDGLTDGELAEVMAYLPALGWAELDLDRFDAARDHLDRALRVASRIRHRALLPGLFAARSAVACRQGHLAVAIRDAQESAARAGQLGQSDEHAFATAVSLPARLWRHGPGAVRGPLAAMPAPQAMPVAWWRPVAAAGCVEVLLQLGRAEAARLVAVTAVELVAGRAGAQYPSLLALAATAELACGRLEVAASLQRQAGEAARAGGLDLQCGAAGLAGARLLLARAAPMDAAREAAAAAAHFDSCGALVDAGRARLVAAEAATALGDHVRARQELALARLALLGSGAHWLGSTMFGSRHRGAVPGF